MARASRAEWAKRVERWRDSGLSAKEYASETGLKATTLSYWKWRLGAAERGRSSGPRPVGLRTIMGRSPAAARAPRFVEVTPAVQTPSAEPLTLELQGAIMVRVPVGFDEETLVRVLRVVRTAT